MSRNNIANLSRVQQAYILTIYQLTQNHGHAHVRSIADNLNVSMASVTEAMGALEDKKLVNYRRRKDITLTPKAKSIVLELEKRRNLLRSFAKDILLYPQNASEKFVEKIAHCIDDEFCERLSRHISRTKNNKVL